MLELPKASRQGFPKFNTRTSAALAPGWSAASLQGTRQVPTDLPNWTWGWKQWQQTSFCNHTYFQDENNRTAGSKQTLPYSYQSKDPESSVTSSSSGDH